MFVNGSICFTVIYFFVLMQQDEVAPQKCNSINRMLMKLCRKYHR
jgi:hypothetical protein